jgi:hypothetical protein
LPSTSNASFSDSQLADQIKVLNTGFSNAALTFELAETTRTRNSEWFIITDPEGEPQKQMKETLRKGGAGDLNVFIVELVFSFLFCQFPRSCQMEI